MTDLLISLGLVAVVSFLLGSVPWGVIVSKVVYKTDVRSVGSGNIGTTNSFRAMGKTGGSVVFVLDFGKGLASGAIGLLSATPFAQMFGVPNQPFFLEGPLAPPTGAFALFASVAFLACIIGHIFSPWLKLKGGKGIACAGGCLLITFGVLGGLIELCIFAVFLLATKRVSVGSLAAAVACPLLSLWLLQGQWMDICICSIGALLVVWAHRGNIRRLLDGTESRIGSKE